MVGNRPSNLVWGLTENDGVTVTGYVADIRPYYRVADVCVMPLRIARGLQNKVLEAMAAAVPVVTTSNVIDGLGAKPGEDVMIGDGADELVAKIVALLEDEKLRRRVGQAGRSFVEKRFSWQVAVERLDQIEHLLSQKRDTIFAADR